MAYFGSHTSHASVSPKVRGSITTRPASFWITNPRELGLQSQRGQMWISRDKFRMQPRPALAIDPGCTKILGALNTNLLNPGTSLVLPNAFTWSGHSKEGGVARPVWLESLINIQAMFKNQRNPFSGGRGSLPLASAGPMAST